MNPQNLQDNNKNHHGDCHTQAGAVREFLTMWFNSTYLWASLIDNFLPTSRLPKTPLGYSLPGVIAGAAFAAGLAYGSAEIQRTLDKYMESSQPLDRDSLHSHDNSAAPINNNHCYDKLVNFLTDSGKLEPKHVAKITLAMLGQAGDLVGFAVGILNASSSFLTPAEKAISNFIILFAGLCASWAAVRPSSHVMKLHAKTARNVPHGQADPNEKPDGWTLLFLAAKILQTSIANIAFYGTIADKMNHYPSNTLLGVSTHGIVDTLLPIIYVTLSVIFFQYFISVMNQGLYREHASDNNDLEMTQVTQAEPISNDNNIIDTSRTEKVLIYILLLGRLMGTGTDCSVPVLFMLNNYLSPSVYLSVALGGTAVGMGISLSDARTCRENWNTFRKKNDAWIKDVSNGIQQQTQYLSRNVCRLFSSCQKKSSPGLHASLLSK